MSDILNKFADEASGIATEESQGQPADDCRDRIGVEQEAEVSTKDFLRLGVPLKDALRRATDFAAKFVLGSGEISRLHSGQP